MGGPLEGRRRLILYRVVDIIQMAVRDADGRWLADARTAHRGSATGSATGCAFLVIPNTHDPHG